MFFLYYYNLKDQYFQKKKHYKGFFDILQNKDFKNSCFSFNNLEKFQLFYIFLGLNIIFEILLTSSRIYYFYE